jgi:uncharacterized membrane protein YsdA (DUF1294 family)
MPALFAALLLVNLLTLLAFRADKAAAVARTPRMPERRLLALAALGGTPAAYAARRLWRHKTVKQPFTAQLHGIAALQCLALAAALWRLS